jgi:hypothetical protein
MFIKVIRKQDSIRITRFSMGDQTPLEFPDNEDVFDVPIEHLDELRLYFEPHFPASPQEKTASTFMLGGN